MLQYSRALNASISNSRSAIIAYIWARASVQEQCDVHAEPLIVAETV
jgi:hypothetical protein